MRNVTKEVFLNSLKCTRLGWLMRTREIERYIEESTIGEKFRIEQGIEIGSRAREVKRGGILVDERKLDISAEKTQALISDRSTSLVYEGTFLVDNHVAKADILERDDGRWNLIEVKSSVNDRPDFIQDMAYTAMVMLARNVELSRIYIMLINRDYRKGMGNENLFVRIEHTDQVLELSRKFMPLMGNVDSVTSSSSMPNASLKFDCRKCPLFKECMGKGVQNHIFDIPGLRQGKFEKLQQLDVAEIRDIPPDFPLTDNQQRVWEAVRCNTEVVQPELSSELERINWPVYYLDFETVMTALPLYNDIAPYTQLPTQYSIHECSAIGEISNYFEYLADPNRDCRRELAEHLIKDLRNSGSIISYSNFEKNTISMLISNFPDLAPQLDNLINRIVDLEKIIKKCLYHPGFHGRTSIKVTLPTLVPELTYEGLDISEGTSAAATFAYMALGKYTEEEAEQKRRNLLEYCERDTLAMVKLHQKLMEYT